MVKREFGERKKCCEGGDGIEWCYLVNQKHRGWVKTSICGTKFDSPIGVKYV
jgi:hypothetical protein